MNDYNSGVQSLNVRSYDDVAMYCEFGEISTPIILLSCPWRVFNGCHVLLDQIWKKKIDTFLLEFFFPKMTETLKSKLEQRTARITNET